MVNRKINLIKMDIEGFVVDVVHRSIQIFKQADIISVNFMVQKIK
jgi:hypothetical protein